MDIKNLNSFLKLGYFLDYNNDSIKFDFSNINKDEYINYTPNDLINTGIEKFKNSIVSSYDSSKDNVVPISGGLDSRAILAGLLECSDASKIYTYTFGSPGTLDYEIGNAIAKNFGTKHTSFPLNENEFVLSELIDISKKVDFQTMLFHHPPVSKLQQKYQGYKIWSGFMGDPLAGSHLGKSIYTDNIDNKKVFIKENTFVKSVDPLCIPESELYDLIEVPEIDPINLSLKEQIDFYNRQLKYVAPHVLMEGFEYILPFLDKDWTSFILSIDNIYRSNQQLYKKILLRAFPVAFSYKTKTNWGLNIDASPYRVLFKRSVNKAKKIINSKIPLFTDKSLNYLDFNQGIRNRKDLNEIFRMCLNDLDNRKLVGWLNIEKLWKDHITGKRNHADILILLTSLEIHLKAKEIDSQSL